MGIDGLNQQQSKSIKSSANHHWQALCQIHTKWYAFCWQKCWTIIATAKFITGSSIHALFRDWYSHLEWARNYRLSQREAWKRIQHKLKEEIRKIQCLAEVSAPVLFLPLDSIVLYTCHATTVAVGHVVTRFIQVRCHSIIQELN